MKTLVLILVLLTLAMPLSAMAGPPRNVVQHQDHWTDYGNGLIGGSNGQVFGDWSMWAYWFFGPGFRWRW